MMQATDRPDTLAASGAADGHPSVAELASTPATAALLAALFDLMHDAKRRGAQTAGTSQILVRLAKSCPARGSDLATDLHLDQSTVSRHLAALEADGLVHRTASAQDKRVHEVELTDAGRAAAVTEIQRRVTALESAVADWSQNDIEELTRLLARFVAGLRATEEGNPRD